MTKAATGRQNTTRGLFLRRTKTISTLWTRRPLPLVTSPSARPACRASACHRFGRGYTRRGLKPPASRPVLTHGMGLKVAVIVNEFATGLGIETSCVSYADERSLRMNKRCICCTFRGLIRSLALDEAPGSFMSSDHSRPRFLADPPAQYSDLLASMKTLRDELSFDAVVHFGGSGTMSQATWGLRKLQEQLASCRCLVPSQQLIWLSQQPPGD